MGVNSSRAARASRPCGLVNFGSTCYFNATITALIGSAAFEEQILHFGETPIEDELLLALYNLCSELMERNRNHPVSPRAAFYKLHKLRPDWGPYEQQDAHELLNFILNHIDECHKKQIRQASRVRHGTAQNVTQTSHNPSLVSIFEGSLSRVTECLACDRTSAKPEKFYDLSLEMSDSLEESLTLLRRNELMNPSEKYFCSDCLQPQNAVRYCTLTHIPRVVIFQLKRFCYDPKSGALSKNRAVCRFPLQLELPHSIQQGSGRVLDCTDIDAIKWRVKRHLRAMTVGSSDSVFPTEIAPFCEVTDNMMERQLRNRPLSLCAVVCHIGNFMSAGHYVTVVRRGNGWWVVDDERVTPLTLQQMEDFCNGVQLTQKELSEILRAENAYLLFYESADS